MGTDIRTVSLSRLRNGTHAEFHENIKITIEKTGAATLGLESLFPLYCAAFSNELESLNFIRKSELTEQISEQDRVRDGIFRGLSDTVKGYRNHFDAQYRVAANKLWNVLLHYGNIARKPLDAQTAAVDDILREFQRPDLAEAIAVLQLQGWTDQLAEENTKFRTLMTDRYSEPAGKTTYRMQTARTETDRYYRGMIMLLEAKILSGYDDPEFNRFIVELNAVIRRYKDILSQEFGRKNAASTGKEKIIAVEKLDDSRYKITQNQ